MESAKKVFQPESTAKARFFKTQSSTAITTFSPQRPSTPVGGHLAKCTQQWHKITKDPWILNTTQGCHINFSRTPPLRNIPPCSRDPHMTKEQAMILSDEIQSLQEKSAIQCLSGHLGPGFYSNVFVVPKRDGGWRPIINLRKLNSYIHTPHFKMENIFSLRDILKKGDWLAKIDLKDAYLTVPMAKAYQKYLRFQWQGKIYEFKSLPFGLATAPITFTKLLRPVVAYLRQQGVRLVVYLDDILLMADTQDLLQQHLQITMSQLTDLGFMLNLKKCVLTPCRRLEFLGFIVDSLAYSLYVPQDKIAKIKKECRHLLNKDKVSGRTLAHIIGLLSSVTPAVLQAPLHYRGLQRLRSRALQQSTSQDLDYDLTVPLSQEARQNLLWWTEYSFQEGRPLRWPQPTLTLESDASKRGWGAHSTHQDQTIGGIWNLEEAAHHINWLELKAAFLGLQAFAQNLSNVHIHLLMDNTVAIAYLNRLGGTRSYALCQLAISIWNWCLQKGITVHADHLPGQLNVRADYASRNWNDYSDWMLDPEVFSQIQKKFGQFSIDLFASFQNTQLPKFFSWKPNPNALAVDALAQQWNHFELPYAFPPFALIGRCLQKVREEKVKRLLMIAPVWPAQHWYPLMLQMLADYLLLYPHQQYHPLIQNGHLTLGVWLVSGCPCQVANFQKILSRSTTPHEENQQRNRTIQSGIAGANQGQLTDYTRNVDDVITRIRLN